MNAVSIKLNINALPDGDRYETVPRASLKPSKGGFKCGVVYFSVSRKGECTEVGRANDCTYAGDEPSCAPVLPPGIPRVLERVRRYGNGSWDSYRLYAAV